jgi:small GTP-binding protein
LKPTASQQESHYNQARASLQQALSWYSSFRRHGDRAPQVELQAAVRTELQSLKAALDKLDRKVIHIAAFGLVSRGKSAVVNALLGEKLFPTGPLHGVTKYPKSARWTPPGGKIEVELIDTPGLDEIDGQARAEMATEVAKQADLILFIVAGDITRVEYEALCELRQSQKPLLLVFNKIDLYPEQDAKAIYEQLRLLGTGQPQDVTLQQALSTDEIICVAAEPAPIQVRIEYPDGQIGYEWETPPPQIDTLRHKILTILNREGRSLLALNALFQAREAETDLAEKTLELRQEEAEAIIWKYAQYKALVVTLNPIAFLDVIGGFFADLALIRALARLYGLPMTSFEAGTLWRKIFASAGGTLLSEVVSSLFVGFGKTTAAVASIWESPAAIATYATAAAAQGAIAGYGAYTVGKAAQIYLANGCSWGQSGPSTTIQMILAEVPPNTILYRLRRELGELL